MNQLLQQAANHRLKLDAETAADLMTTTPVSLRDVATLKEAVALLIDKGISAAPVIDAAGRPVGVLSQTDLLIQDRRRAAAAPLPEYFEQHDLATRGGEPLPDGFQVECVNHTQVSELMTPVVFAVPPNTPAQQVVEQMLARKVHRLFVVDDDGVLVGVVSAVDVLRHLRP